MLSLLRHFAWQTPHQSLLETREKIWSYQDAESEVARRVAQYQIQKVKAGRRVLVAERDPAGAWFSLLALDALGAVPVMTPVGKAPLYLEALLAEPSQGEGIILFTSGSTGQSKAVLLKKGALARNAYLQNQLTHFHKNSRVWVPSAPYFTSALVHFLSVLHVGGTVKADLASPFGKGFLKQLDDAQITAVAGVPALILRALSSEEKAPLCLETWVSSGEHLPAATVKRFLLRYPSIDLVTFYGMTEWSGRIVGQGGAEQRLAPGAAGKSLGRTSLSCVNGEIYLQGQLGMLGYRDDGGFQKIAVPFATGDLGQIDDAGRLWLSGRKDRVFKSGAMKIAPQAIEETTLEHPSVSEARVEPEADILLGTVPVLWYVPISGHSLTATELTHWLRDRLDASSLPKKIHRVEALPRAKSGKLLPVGAKTALENPFR